MSIQVVLNLVLNQFLFKEFAHASAIEGGSNEEIFEPVVVISKVIEVSKWRSSKSAVPLNFLAVRMKIP